MKKTYLAPKAESISVETYIIAASTNELTRSSNYANSSDIPKNSKWGDIWNK